MLVNVSLSSSIQINPLTTTTPWLIYKTDSIWFISFLGGSLSPGNAGELSDCGLGAVFTIFGTIVIGWSSISSAASSIGVKVSTCTGTLFGFAKLQ